MTASGPQGPYPFYQGPREPSKPLGNGTNKEIGIQYTTKRHALRNQAAGEIRPSKDADCPLGPSVAPTSSRPLYSGRLHGNSPCVEGQPATANDHLRGDLHSFSLPAASNEVNNRVTLQESPPGCNPASLGASHDYSGLWGWAYESGSGGGITARFLAWLRKPSIKRR